MSQSGCHTTEQIEQRESTRSEPIFDGGAEDPERPHVQDEVQPSRVQEDVGQERGPVRRGDEAQLPEEARGHQRELEQEPIQHARRQAGLIEEREDAHADDRPYDDGRVAARDAVKIGKQAADPRSR